MVLLMLENGNRSSVHAPGIPPEMVLVNGNSQVAKNFGRGNDGGS